jgi:hypothetical protein
MSLRYRSGRRMWHGTQVGRHRVPCTCSSTRRLARLLQSFSLPCRQYCHWHEHATALGKPRILLLEGVDFGVLRADRAGNNSASQAGGLGNSWAGAPRQRLYLPRLLASATFPPLLPTALLEGDDAVASESTHTSTGHLARSWRLLLGPLSLRAAA